MANLRKIVTILSVYLSFGIGIGIDTIYRVLYQ